MGLGRSATAGGPPADITSSSAAKTGIRTRSSLRERLMKGIDAQVAETEKPPTEDQKRIVRKEVDINGINPLDCLIGAVPTAALSYGSWQLTNGVAAWFEKNPVMFDFYPAQRLAIAIELLLVALSSL